MSLQQNVSLPGGQSPVIQQSSLVGEVYAIRSSARRISG